MALKSRRDQSMTISWLLSIRLSGNQSMITSFNPLIAIDCHRLLLSIVCCQAIFFHQFIFFINNWYYFLYFCFPRGRVWLWILLLGIFAQITYKICVKLFWLFTRLQSKGTADSHLLSRLASDLLLRRREEIAGMRWKWSIRCVIVVNCVSTALVFKKWDLV